MNNVTRVKTLLMLQTNQLNYNHQHLHRQDQQIFTAVKHEHHHQHNLWLKRIIFVLAPTTHNATPLLSGLGGCAEGAWAARGRGAGCPHTHSGRNRWGGTGRRAGGGGRATGGRGRGIEYGQKETQPPDSRGLGEERVGECSDALPADWLCCVNVSCCIYIC